MISTLAFASCYVYSPAGAGVISERSRLLRALLKEGNAHFMLKYAVRVRQQTEDSSRLAGFFLSNDVLVPVPRCSPRSRGTWVAAELAQALVRAGVGGVAWPGLRRIRAVRKSATAASGARPTVACHYDSFEVESVSFRAAGVMLVDDVVTRGRTLLAAAARLTEAFPGTPVRAFALLRTRGMVPGVEHLLEPCTGEIRWNGSDTRRTP
ncbi:MAG TPA: phosphoribosyltransferase [Steroidobacteraceae bacterium]|nr:phosphoribosyltransferase [Steroidobacteraceae bacterium]